MRKRKPSLQKEKILELVQHSHEHPTADWIYAKLKPEIPRLSLGTVYRNLNNLVQEKKIAQLMVGNVAHYDARTTPHYHFICEVCGTIYDLDTKTLEDAINQIIRTLPHHVTTHEITFRGICQKCRTTHPSH